MLVSRRGAEMDVPEMWFIIFLSRPRADEQSPQTAAGFHRRHAGWQILQRLRLDSTLLHRLPAETHRTCQRQTFSWLTASRCDQIRYLDDNVSLCSHFSPSWLRSDVLPLPSWVQSHLHRPEHNVSKSASRCGQQIWSHVDHEAFAPWIINRCSFLNQTVSRYRHTADLVLFCTWLSVSVRQT